MTLATFAECAELLLFNRFAGLSLWEPHAILQATGLPRGLSTAFGFFPMPFSSYFNLFSHPPGLERANRAFAEAGLADPLRISGEGSQVALRRVPSEAELGEYR